MYYYDHHLKFLTDTMYQFIKERFYLSMHGHMKKDLLSTMHHT